MRAGIRSHARRGLTAAAWSRHDVVRTRRKLDGQHELISIDAVANLELWAIAVA
jgi:hypothetical protein